MTGGARTCVDEPGVASVQVSQGTPQTVFVYGHQNEVHVVGHEAVGPYLGAGTGAAVCQQVSIEGIVPLFEKSPLSTIAPLGDVMGKAGDDHSSKPSHEW